MIATSACPIYPDGFAMAPLPPMFLVPANTILGNIMPVMCPPAQAYPEHNSATTPYTPEKLNLANHISAPSLQSAASDVMAQIDDPARIMDDSKVANKVEQTLEHGTCKDVEEIVTWLLEHDIFLYVSLSKLGSRVAQAAIAQAKTDQLTKLISCFHGNVLRLLQSPNGNYVLQKAIEVIHGASESMKFILVELAKYPGGWSAMAKDQFGCRVVQRVVEHCPEEATANIVNAVKAEAKIFVRHPYANYVLQSILEHGTPNQKVEMVRILVGLGIVSLSHSHVTSNILETAWDHGDKECQKAIFEAILKYDGAIIGMACNRWGSNMVKRIVEARHIMPFHGTAIQQLLHGEHVLRQSKHGKKIANKAKELQSTFGGA